MSQGIGEIMVEIGELQSKLRAFDTITNLLTIVDSDIIGDVQDHLNVINEYVSSTVLRISLISHQDHATTLASASGGFGT